MDNFPSQRMDFDEFGQTIETLIASNTYGKISYGAGTRMITIEGQPVLAIVTVCDTDEDAGLGDRPAALHWLCRHGLPLNLAVDLVDYAIGMHHSALGTN